MSPTDNRRAWVDDRFLRDMYAICARKYSSSGPRSDCRSDAAKNHVGVRIGGGAPFFGQ